MYISDDMTCNTCGASGGIRTFDGTEGLCEEHFDLLIQDMKFYDIVDPGWADE